MSLVNFCIVLGLIIASGNSREENALFNDLEIMLKSVFKLVCEPAIFNLYTRENPFGEEQLFLNNTEVLYASHFNESRPTKFIVHGFSDTGSELWVRNLIDAYLLHEDVNVIVVGWGPLAAELYPIAANNTQRVGKFLGSFLEFLNRESNLEYKDVHISGHSLGSHVAGFAGAYLEGRIGRITGLDPASPLFETISGIVDPDFRLDPTDAQFVDIIHTSGPAFGFLAPLGHADFYPNNGTFPQPGCSFWPTTSMIFFGINPFVGIDIIVRGIKPCPVWYSRNTYCSHSRAHQFMTESIGSTSGFKARACENWKKYKEGRCNYNPVVLMGEYASTSLRGKFYLTTNDAPPFAV